MPKKKIDLERHDACPEGHEFYKEFETSIEVWNACHRGDWMLWAARELGVDDRKLTPTKAHCANTVRHLMKDERSKKYVDGAIAYGKGDIEKAELEGLYSEAIDASYDAGFGSSDYNAASAAAYYSDYHMAMACYHEASDSDKEAAWIANRKQTADICREYLTEEIKEIINKQK